MQSVAAALGDDVHEAADSPAELGAVAAVDDAELLHCVLRRCSFLDARGRRHVVGAIDSDEIVVNILTGEGKLGDRLDDHIGAA